MTKHNSQRKILLLASLLLASCGGGDGGGGSSPPATVAPSDLQYPSAPAYTVQVAISTMTPTVTGQVASYGVSPALPAGIAFNSSSGAISGTPTALTPKTTYVVTAKNSAGSTTASLSLVVNSVAPSISYPSPSYGFTAGVASQTVTPTHTGGAVVSWSVTPALPAGLTLSTTTGTISGTPTASAVPTGYVVIATNSGGQSPFSLTIGVAAAPLLDLGHSNTVVLMRTTTTDLLSLDVSGHWILQDILSGTTLAGGDGACGTGYCPEKHNGVYTFPFLPVDAAGSTMIDIASGGLEVRSATDGHVLATLPGQFLWYQLASDGSYIAAGSATALTAWTTSGQVIFSKMGDYAAALTFSAPGQLQVALGAKGAAVIETISIPAGISSLSPAFQGTFSSWFSDGARFLTSLNTAVWIYSSAGVQQDLTQLTGTGTLAGEGNWFWTYGSTPQQLNIYKVGASTSPAFSGQFGDIFAQAISSGTTIGIPSGEVGQITVIDLSGSTPVSASYTAPMSYLSAYGATTAAAWFVANEYGVVVDGASLSGQPRYLALGEAWSIVGGTGYFSVATASGEIFNYNAATDALDGTIPFSSSQLSISSDGTVLAALANTNYSQYSTDRTINLYSLPSGSVIHSFPYTYNTSPFPASMSLSGGGTVILINYATNTPTCVNQAFPASGGSSIWCGVDASSLGPDLSPDGTLIALHTMGTTAPSSKGTNIYKNGTLVTAVPGWSIGWLDNGRLLAVTNDSSNNYTGSVIYGPTGTQLASSPIPDIYEFNGVTSNSIYSPTLNEILSLTTGAPTWASGSPLLTQGAMGPSLGAIAGSQVIFTSGSWVLAQQY
jgi:hypothetical protein